MKSLKYLNTSLPYDQDIEFLGIYKIETKPMSIQKLCESQYSFICRSTKLETTKISTISEWIKKNCGIPLQLITKS